MKNILTSNIHILSRIAYYLTIWRSAGFKDFCAKTTGSHVA